MPCHQVVRLTADRVHRGGVREVELDCHLVDTPSGGQFTVFTPIDDAFAKLPSVTIDSLKTDSAGLTDVLTYRVGPGRVNPRNVDGVHKTLQGADLTVTGFCNNLRVR